MPRKACCAPSMTPVAASSSEDAEDIVKAIATEARPPLDADRAVRRSGMQTVG